jgi:hypothetical protein
MGEAIGYKNQNVDLEPKFDTVRRGSTLVWHLYFSKDYWQFIEHGVNGTKENKGSKFSFKNDTVRIPVKGLEQWIQKRNIRIQTAQKGKAKGLAIAKGRKSLAYAMSVSIKRKGIEPRPFVDKIMTKELMDELKTGMAKILGEEVLATFKTTQ